MKDISTFNDNMMRMRIGQLYERNPCHCKVREALEIELGGGERTGMEAHIDADGRICFTHNYALLVGRKV